MMNSLLLQGQERPIQLKDCSKDSLSLFTHPSNSRLANNKETWMQQHA